jgi:AcrR family transcriptional regulator
MVMLRILRPLSGASDEAYDDNRISIRVHIDTDVYSKSMASSEPVPTSEPGGPPQKPGRKRDPQLNGRILNAALEVLAEHGYEGMTIDMVAARVKTARATVYRRWATKADLVVDAVAHLSRTDADLADLPDTGTLRGDLIARIMPQTIEEQQLRVRVINGLLSNTDPRLAEVTADAGLEPWIDAVRTLMQRAVERGEYAGADVETIAQVIPMMCLCRAAIQQLPITREFSISLIDGVILPAMRGAAIPATPPS